MNLSTVCFALKNIPDLTLNKYQSLADTGVSGVLQRHEDFLRQWHGICLASQISMHLLYIYDPSLTAGERLLPFLMLQGDEERLRLAKPLLKYSPLSDFYIFFECPIPGHKFKYGATMTKKERVAEIYNNLSGQVRSFHYVPKWETADECRLYDLYRTLEAVGKSYTPQPICAFRLDLYPDKMEQRTRSSFTPVMKELKGDNDIKLVRDSQSNRNDYASDVAKQYEDWLEGIETSPHFRVNMYSFADNIFQAKVILNSAASEAIDKGDFSVAPIKADSDGGYTILSRMDPEPSTYCFYPSQATLPEWSTTFLLSEAVPFFRFPVLYDGENIETPKETQPASVVGGMYIGKDNNGFPVNFPTEDLPRHAFFTGMPGSGKTNTMLHLVTELKKQGIPFLALEPAKKEYRALLANESMQDVALFSPHVQTNFPLQLNPFEFPNGVRLSEHLTALLEVFQGSFSLEGPTYKFLSSSIQSAYEKLGWDIEYVNSDDLELEYPSLNDIYYNLESEIEQSSYDSEIKGNVRSFLQVRLGGLMERDAGEVFNARYSTLQPEEWLTTSAIVELEVLNEQVRSFFILLVCHYILETLRANPNGGVDAAGRKIPVRHVVFIEEAHNIIASESDQSGSDSVNPKVSATAYIIKMLAEVRALREAIIIADQLPTALATEVTKNTGFKLVHRLASQDDRELIGAAISATPVQLEQVGTFTKGKALIYYEKTQKPFEVQVAEWKSTPLEFDIANDIDLLHHLHDRVFIKNAVYTLFDNWVVKYFVDIEESVSTWESNCKHYILDGNSDVVAGVDLKLRRTDLIKQCQKTISRANRLKKQFECICNVDSELQSAIDEVVESINLIIAERLAQDYIV